RRTAVSGAIAPKRPPPDRAIGHCHINELSSPSFLPVPRFRGKTTGTPRVSRSRAPRHRHLEPDSKGYTLARRLTASWMQARVTKVARVSARFSKSLARRRFRPDQEKVRS